MKELPKWQKDFYITLYTEKYELAVATNSEKEIIIDATNLIKEYRAKLANEGMTPREKDFIQLSVENVKLRKAINQILVCGKNRGWEGLHDACHKARQILKGN